MALGTQPFGQGGGDVPASTGYHHGTHGQAPRQNNKLVICTIGGLAQNCRQPWIIRDVANVRDRVVAGAGNGCHALKGWDRLSTTDWRDQDRSR